MPNLFRDGEILLYGYVGENFWGDGFTDRDVLDALAEAGRDTDIIVRINSGGGYVDHGTAIYNALAAHKGKVTVQIDGIAASSASLIAMAGEEIIMRKGTLMMIHDPATIVAGTAADIEKARAYLDKTAEQMAGIYADRCGDEQAAVRAEMKQELWLTADEAVARGFADTSDSGDAVTASAFDYRVYAHAPSQLTALAKANKWSLKAAQAAKPKAESRKPNPTEDNDMTEQEKAALEASAKKTGAVEAQARIKAIMTSAEAKGREPQAEHFAYETEMPAEAAIAALKVAPVAADPAKPEGEKKPETEAEKAAAYEAMRLKGQSSVEGDGKPPVKAKISHSSIYAARAKRA